HQRSARSRGKRRQVARLDRRVEYPDVGLCVPRVGLSHRLVRPVPLQPAPGSVGMTEAPSIRATTLEATDTGAIARMQGINRWYGAFHALRGIVLQVESGERIVICGPSGSG